MKEPMHALSVGVVLVVVFITVWLIEHPSIGFTLLGLVVVIFIILAYFRIQHWMIEYHLEMMRKKAELYALKTSMTPVPRRNIIRAEHDQVVLIDTDEGVMTAWHPVLSNKGNTSNGTSDVDPSIVVSQCPSFREAIRDVRSNQFILGYDENGPIYTRETDFVSMGVLGIPRSGKSNYISWLVAQAVKRNIAIELWDPHGVNDLHQISGITVYNGIDEIDERGVQIGYYFTQAIKTYQSGQQVPPLLLIVDELTSISEHAEQAMAFVNRALREGPKFGLTLVLASHGFPSELFDYSMTRDAISSYIAFNTKELQARMLGFDKEEVRRYLPIVKQQKGVGILYTRHDGQTRLVSVPEVSVRDVQSITA